VTTIVTVHIEIIAVAGPTGLALKAASESVYVCVYLAVFVFASVSVSVSVYL
jgi:hypothetical protein